MKNHAKFLILFALICSCHYKESGYEKDIAQVFYLCGDFETSVAIAPSSIKEMSNSVTCSKNIFTDSIKTLKLTSILNKNYNTDIEKSIDCRMYINMGQREYVVDANNRMYDIVGAPVHVDDNYVYFIKELSGYYNYLDIKSLQEDSLIQKYGFPSNYKYYYKDKKIADPKEEMKKIRIIKTDNSR